MIKFDLRGHSFVLVQCIWKKGHSLSFEDYHWMRTVRSYLPDDWTVLFLTRASVTYRSPSKPEDLLVIWDDNLDDIDNEIYLRREISALVQRQLQSMRSPVGIPHFIAPLPPGRVLTFEGRPIAVTAEVDAFEAKPQPDSDRSIWSILEDT
jgi:hypothetical protein